MKRRSFLKLTGGVFASALAGKQKTWAAEKPVRIDRKMLSNRNQNRSTVICRNGMVCTSQPLAAMAGMDILKAGGNAFDAAICINAMLSLVEPMNCGPGGDVFVIAWSEKDKKLYGLNGSGRAPYNWSLEALKEAGHDFVPGKGPLSWTVPGCVDGWSQLMKRFGSRSEAELLAPAIHYATEGFPVSPIVASYDENWTLKKRQFESLAKTFRPNGKGPRFGEIFKNPGLASFFKILAKEGFDSFYKGQIAERIVKFSKEVDGRFSMRDFADHKSEWIEPVSSNYRGYDVWELPPNGQGIAALQLLNILEQFDIGAMEHNSADYLHLFTEAKKLAFEDRAVYYADPKFADVPVEYLISKDYAKKRAKLIDLKKARWDVISGDVPESGDTVYLTAADSDGNMVSLIQSISSWWGSGLVPDGMGFCIQNRGTGFSVNPNHRNKLEPGKRPFHTIIPGFVTQSGKPVFSFGVVMGSFQPQGHAQILNNIIDFGMSVQQAAEQPRIRHMGSSQPMGRDIKIKNGGKIGFERGIADSVKAKLAAMGHRIKPGVGSYGGFQGIWRKENPRRYFGGTDPRLDGCAIGY